MGHKNEHKPDCIVFDTIEDDMEEENDLIANEIDKMSVFVARAMHDTEHVLGGILGDDDDMGIFEDGATNQGARSVLSGVLSGLDTLRALTESCESDKTKFEIFKARCFADGFEVPDMRYVSALLLARFIELGNAELATTCAELLLEKLSKQKRPLAFIDAVGDLEVYRYDYGYIGQNQRKVYFMSNDQERRRMDLMSYAVQNWVFRVKDEDELVIVARFKTVGERDTDWWGDNDISRIRERCLGTFYLFIRNIAKIFGCQDPYVPVPPIPKGALFDIATEPENPVNKELWLDTKNVQGACLMEWVEEIGAWCQAGDDKYELVGIQNKNKEKK